MKHPIHRGSILLASCGIVFLGTVPAASAQGRGSEAGSAENAIALEEVIVTARKREETLLEIPVAVTALSASDIEEKGIENLNDVALFTPGLTYFDSIQNQLGTPVIRGISQTNLNSPDRNVAIFYGGVYLSNLSASNLEIMDVARIEVVKGPQSALYGRNAFNGAINYVPAAPTENFFARVEGTVGTDERYEGKLTVSGPLGEKLRGRFFASYNTFDGTYSNAFDAGDNLAGFETKNASGMLDFDATDDLRFRLFGLYTDDHREHGALYFLTPNNCGPAGVAATAFCGEVPYRASIAASPLSEGFYREVTLGALDITYTRGGLTFVSQTAQYDATVEAFSEYSANGVGHPYQVISRSAVAALTAMGVTPINAYRAVPTLRTQNIVQYTGAPPNDTSTFSQELRVESDPEKRLRGSFGVFYYKNEYSNIAASSLDIRGLGPDETLRDPVITFTFTNPAVLTTNPRNLFVATNVAREDLQRSVFASAEFDLGDNFTIGGELRRDEEDRQQVSRILGPSSQQRQRFRYGTWRYHADYSLSPTQKFYASVAKGLISGHFNGTFDAFAGIPLAPEFQKYDPAENRTYELGWKAEWLDRRLNTELALFYINYDGIQINATPPPPYVATFIQNLGNAKSRGVEASATLAVTDGWRVGATYGYSPTEFSQGTFEPSVARYCGALAAGFCPTLTFRGALQPDVSGQSLNRAPELTASAWTSFERPLANDWSIYGRADASYTSKAYTLTYNLQYLPERTIVNARLGVRRGKKLDVALWGRNILDEEYVTAVIFQPFFVNFAFAPNVTQGDGATFGLTASYRFGD